MVEKILLCQCSSCEHQIIVRYDEKDDEVYCSIHLANRGFWMRLKHAIKYLFGYKCIYGDFEEFIFRKEDGAKLHEIANKLTNE